MAGEPPLTVQHLRQLVAHNFRTMFDLVLNSSNVEKIQNSRKLPTPAQS
ncbi:hypothetical protein VCR4J5_1650035 [Vibrio crassostreae]|uniref:Uncharacterized protein n=1 Tax=Vibrio crassostreae TaxID=246167 RepID=A0ABP1WXB2_9VIBR|nr:hypothetical protein VCR4J5_1650035 [Vibrio crassostreae]CDT64508.1 hypothetical protein VCR19J5_880001 [Vibrio crassostreae]CDT75303.1 hypothetical protein VCR15J2_520002 [Vibrio coralliirubri]